MQLRACARRCLICQGSHAARRSLIALPTFFLQTGYTPRPRSSVSLIYLDLLLLPSYQLPLSAFYFGPILLQLPAVRRPIWGRP